MYLGWDVGIKNLAFCLLENKNKQLHIVDWGIINLLVHKPPKIYCNCLKKEMDIQTSTNTYMYLLFHQNPVSFAFQKALLRNLKKMLLCGTYECLCRATFSFMLISLAEYKVGV